MESMWRSIQANRFLLGTYGKVQSNLLYYYPIDKEYWNADLITDKLWLGDMWSAYNTAQLKERGITNILTAIGGFHALAHDGVTSRHLDWLDTPSQSIVEDLDEAVKSVHEAILNDKIVLVHCRKGISRSASIVIAYMMKYHNMNFEEAINHVKSKRSRIKPNDGFQKQLKEYELRLKENNNKQLESYYEVFY